MQLLEYMKNPGTGWKSQDEQLIVAFQEAHSTPFFSSCCLFVST